MSTLVATGNVVQVPTIDSLLNPALFHIKDINQYKLTDEEMVEGVDGNDKVQALFAERKEFMTAVIKKYGSKLKKTWSVEDKNQITEKKYIYKQARKVLVVRLARAKFSRLFDMTLQYMVILLEGNVLDEDKVPLLKRQIELTGLKVMLLMKTSAKMTIAMIQKMILKITTMRPLWREAPQKKRCWVQG